MTGIVEQVAERIAIEVAGHADVARYYRPEARAAIRATLKAYAEDFWNKVGDLVPVAGLGENATVEQQSAYVEVWHYSELARAFEALLAELDGPESEGR